MAAGKPRRELEPWAHALCGFVAGTNSTAVLYPLELVKARLQSAHWAEYTSTPAAFRTIVRKDGVRELYRGFTFGLFANSAAWGLYFFGYNSLKNWRRGHCVDGKLHFWDHMGASAIAGTTVSFLLCPAWVIKLNLQLGAFNRIIPDCRSLHQTEGLAGFYRGLTPGILACGQGALQFAVYEAVRAARVEAHESQDLPWVETFAATTISKSLAMAVWYPVEVLKTRMRHVASSPERNYSSTLSTVRDVWSKERLPGFYKGIGLAAARVLPAQWVTFITYEKCKSLLHAWQM
jgi:solute carrier family 25 folate transporter 32